MTKVGFLWYNFLTNGFDLASLIRYWEVFWTEIFFWFIEYNYGGYSDFDTYTFSEIHWDLSTSSLKLSSPLKSNLWCITVSTRFCKIPRKKRFLGLNHSIVKSRERLQHVKFFRFCHFWDTQTVQCDRWTYDFKPFTTNDHVGVCQLGDGIIVLHEFSRKRVSSATETIQ